MYYIQGEVNIISVIKKVSTALGLGGREDTEIKEAMDVLYSIIGDKELIQLAEMSDKAIRDEKSRLQGARDEGRQEGRVEGIRLGAKDALAKSTIKLLRKKFKEITRSLRRRLLL